MNIPTHLVRRWDKETLYYWKLETRNRSISFLAFLFFIILRHSCLYSSQRTPHPKCTSFYVHNCTRETCKPYRGPSRKKERERARQWMLTGKTIKMPLIRTTGHENNKPHSRLSMRSLLLLCYFPVKYGVYLLNNIDCLLPWPLQ